jgi:hypothetical protein
MMLPLLFMEMSAHFLADFTFQNDKFCREKQERSWSKAHLYHAGIVFLLAWLLSFQVQFWWAALTIAVTHFFVDNLKSIFYRKAVLGASRNYLFFIDQAVHLIIIMAVVACYTATNVISPELVLVAYSFFALVVCTSPANFLIREYMQLKGFIHGDDNSSLLQAGRVIGTLERVLTFILIAYNQFAAVGFIIAAKSILRFRDTQTAKTEYLLIGSLLSFGIAITLGIIFQTIKKQNILWQIIF